MNEFRKDYLLKRWVIIAKDRGKRPNDFTRKKEGSENKANASNTKEEGTCYFCPGNENTTPPEISRVEENGKWIIRCFPNKFPATRVHEVITETPNHGEELCDLSVGHLVKVLDMYTERLTEIKREKDIKYVLIFKNSGDVAGASLSHSHTQVTGMTVVPTLVQREADRSREYRNDHGSCPFCDTIKKEMKSERKIFEDDHTAAFAPFASRFPFEVWIMPKRHVTSLTLLDADEKYSFAGTLKKILTRLNSLGNPAYNFYLHIAPEGEDLHFHLELAPRLSKWAGFELGSDIIINIMPPEIAAEHYRG